MGQGHAYAGEYARQRGLNTGANPMVLMGATPEAASGGLPYLAVKVQLAATGARRSLAIPQATQDQDDREIAQHVALGAARELELRGRAPEHASHPSMYPRSSIRSTGGACRSTSTSAPGARPAWSPASPRITSRWW